MRASRLLTLLMLLQARGRCSARALAAATEVSVRTIYRDIDQLSAAGVPVWAEPGRAGGICLRAGWHAQPTGLTAPEARAVALAGLPGPAAELGLGPAMVEAQRKLLAALPADARADAGRMAQLFHLDPVDWFRSTAPPAHLQAMADAVWTRHRVAMRYASWQQVSDRVVEPLGLVLKAGTWYVVARTTTRSTPAVFRLAAIESLQVLDEVFPAPEGFELAAFWRSNATRFEAGVVTGTARLRVSEAGFTRLSRLCAAVAQAALDSAAPCDHEGWVEVVVPIESVQHAVHALLQLGAEAEVLAPSALRARLRAEVQQMAAMHGP